MPEKPSSMGRMTKSQLSRKLGIWRAELDKHLNRPGAPEPDKRKTYSLREVTGWIAMQHDAKPGSLEEWRLKELQLKCERLQRELDLAARQVLTIEAHGRFVERHARSVRDNLYAVLTQELPAKIVGMGDVATVRRALRDAGDAICVRMQKQAEDFLNDYQAGKEV